MSLKKDLAREIEFLEEEIKNLEFKRSRSQASIIESLVSKTEPDEMDLKFFRTYTADIEVKRERLTKLKKQYEDIV